MPAFPQGASARGGAAAALTHREQCRQADALVAPLILELRGRGLSLRAIARELTARGVPTRREGSYHLKRGRWHYKPGVWHARQVARVLERAEAAPTEAATQQTSTIFDTSKEAHAGRNDGGVV